MRLLLAGVFVFASFLAGVLTLSSVYGKGPWPWWATALPLVAGAGSMLISMFLFNRPGQRPTLRARTLDEVIAELDSKGLILRQRFQAKRAFVVEEYEDEGPHYYLELEDGGVLHLTGQHLYDFEPSEGEPEQPRSFPSTEFTILSHKDAAYVLHIECSGAPIEPELRAPTYTKQDLERGVPEDQEVIRDRSFDELKHERAEASRGRGR